jgi:hypothetical protein
LGDENYQQLRTRHSAPFVKASMTRITAAKYMKMSDPQDPPKALHTWRTRPDRFAAIWAEAEAPELEAKRIFEHFPERFPGRFQEG